ncbi:DNA replication complex GINS protein PSF1 [Scheffersomyces amazonensis]|uniref:DNA replication complex GINS protein PSF1 n=1 Tax=Scheffersomyces amazonensis TaxID=1078765 RepID=UPI00315D14AD
MYGEIANKLILDAKRTQNLSEIPLYQTDLVKDILKEIQDLNNDSEYLIEQQQQLEEEPLTEEEMKINQCQIFVTQLSMRRNKRCLLAYERLRSEKIVEFSWLNVNPIIDSSTSTSSGSGSGSGNSLNNSKSKSSGTDSNSIYNNYTTSLTIDNLNHAEQDYYKGYQDLILNYKSKFSDIDLSGDLEPPTNIFIDVRVLKDAGEVQTEYGSFNLIKDSQFYVRKSDVDRLIQQGYLEEL